ncbi:MAG TPA: peroxiredoxin [Vulgatibacter sp.]|nr:peroxiredoxin [Vulgatibacter sp.]
MLREGDRAPDVTLTGPDGRPVRLLELAGDRILVVYFYPKDDTPVCTTQACGFRERHDEFLAAGAVVIGISADPPASHARFAAKNELPFPLLSDESGEARRAFGVKPFLGLLAGRVTFVVDRAGVIRLAHAAQLRARSHVDRALEVVRAIAAGAGTEADADR